MAITGSQKTVTESKFSRYIGLFRGHVVAVNPSREELNALRGVEDSPDDKPLTYTKEEDGLRKAVITFWIEVDGKKDVDGKAILLPHTIVLKDRTRRNKAGDKIQLINQLGSDQWVVADEDNNYNPEDLFESFTNFTRVTKWQKDGKESDKWFKGAKPAPGGVEILGDKTFRIAMDGEGELVSFLKVWLGGLETRDFKQDGTLNTSCNLLLDLEQFLNGNFEDLQLVGSSFADREYQGNSTPIGFVGLAYVRVDEEDPSKQYQKVFNLFLPANFIKFINNGNTMPSQFAKDKWAEFVEEVEGEHGLKDAYVLEPLREYDSNEDIAASPKTRPDVDDDGPGY